MGVFCRELQNLIIKSRDLFKVLETPKDSKFEFYFLNKNVYSQYVIL